MTTRLPPIDTVLLQTTHQLHSRRPVGFVKH
jgi:hypothetical protein